jgi:hypothetical protein
MELIQVSGSDYSSIIPNPYHCLNDASFNEVNKMNCEAVHYFLFKDKKYRLGVIGGKDKKKLITPFSAPFGGFSFLSKDVSIKYIEEAISLLEEWCKRNGLERICFTLPPAIYNPTFTSKQLNSLYRSGYQITALDLNYHFINKDVEVDYFKLIRASARKLLKQSFNHNLFFFKCGNTKENIDAYEVIRKNRNARNFPLRMKYEDIEKTNIRKDFFIIKNESEVNIAAAVVYFISSDIVQVVYWGDDPEYSASRPMNFLSFHIFKYYHSQGVLYTDVGPSTENSIPNYGLCDFKEGIGCQVLPKHTLDKKL